MALAHPSRAAGKRFGFVLATASVVGLIALAANPVTSLRMESWAAWVVPVVLGALSGVFATYWYFVPGAIQAKSSAKTSGSRAPGRGVLAAIMVFGFTSLATRESLQAIGAALGGTEQSVAVIVDDVRKPSGAKNRCLEFATFKLEAGELREICVENRYRHSVPHVQLAHGSAVTLVVVRNFVGSWVSAVRPASKWSPNTSLERTRER
jgi:hypothetical protein